MGEEERTAISDAIAEQTALEGDDAMEIGAKSQALAEASMKLGQAMYEDSAAQDAAADAAADAADDMANEDVVDADFEEIDDEDEKKSA